MSHHYMEWVSGRIEGSRWLSLPFLLLLQWGWSIWTQGREEGTLSLFSGIIENEIRDLKWVTEAQGTREAATSPRRLRESTAGQKEASGQPGSMVWSMSMNGKIRWAICEWCCLYLFCRLIQASADTYLLQSLGKSLNSVILLLNSKKNDGAIPLPTAHAASW